MKKTTRFIRFLGSSNTIFTLFLLILLGLVIFIYMKVSFIFHPIMIIFSTIAPPMILAFIFYYIFNPVVGLLERLHIKRLWGIMIIIIVIGGIITGITFLIIPSVEKQVNELTTEIPEYIQQLGKDFKSIIGNSFLGPYYDEGYQAVTSTLNNLSNKFQNSSGSFYKGFINIASKVTHVIVSLFTFPFVLFFLLKDTTALKDYFLHLLPPKFRNDANFLLKNMSEQVGAYIRGQLIVAVSIGILLYVGYLIIGLEFAVTLAVIAALTNVVPYVGPIIAISPAIIIALVDSPFMLIKLAIVWAVVQFSEGHFISPNVMGHTMKIHPLTIMFTLLIGGELFGILGIILGIPGYAILKVIVTYFFTKFKQRYNKYYQEDAGAYQIQIQKPKK